MILADLARNPRLVLAVVFKIGLRRYESGSAINVNI
jgi:hypothetical protein